MNRQEFMDKLKSLLKNVDEVEFNNAIAYYEEYFDEAGKEQEQQVIARLGSPYIIANKILAEDTVNKIKSGKKSPTIGAKGIVLTILSILSIPVALPITIAIVAVLLSLAIALFAVTIAFFASGVGLVIGGVGSLIVGLVVLFMDALTGLQFIGASFILLGVGGLLTILALFMVKVVFIKLTVYLHKGINKIINSINKKRGNRDV